MQRRCWLQFVFFPPPTAKNLSRRRKHKIPSKGYEIDFKLMSVKHLCPPPTQPHADLSPQNQRMGWAYDTYMAPIGLLFCILREFNHNNLLGGIREGEGLRRERRLARKDRILDFSPSLLLVTCFDALFSGRLVHIPRRRREEPNFLFFFFSRSSSTTEACCLALH